MTAPARPPMPMAAASAGRLSGPPPPRYYYGYGPYPVSLSLLSPYYGPAVSFGFGFGGYHGWRGLGRRW